MAEFKDLYIDGDLMVTGKLYSYHFHDDLYYPKYQADTLFHPKWKMVYSGDYSITTSSPANLTLNTSMNYYNKTLAFEVRFGTSSDTYETHIVFARMGSDSTTTASSSYDRLYSWTVFDGQYLKVHSFKAYCANTVSSIITVGYLKHLIGNFTGTTVAWQTTLSTATYIEKIWLVN